MKVGALIEPRAPGAAEFAVAAESMGVASLWVPEVWGYDALTGLAFLAAKTTDIGLGTFVVQLGSRSPALLATSALSLQELSGGRFMLGVGTSGPGVMEGWHGVRFRHAEGYAFTIGAMGAGGRNFYSDAFTRLGYGDGVRTVTQLWKAGRREEARQAVPIDLGRLTNLLGTDDAIADRVGRYQEVGITTLLAKLDGDYGAQLTALERLVAIVADQ